jgi:hypothetical protein
VDGSQVGILEQRDEVRLGRLLKSLFGERWEIRFRENREIHGRNEGTEGENGEKNVHR